MLSSIHPLGERGRGFNFNSTATAFVAGSTLGGLATGAVFGSLGQLLRWLVSPAESAVIALAALALAASAAAVVERRGITIPSLPRQVNEDWIHEYRGWVYGSGFGFQLGFGLMTYVTSAAVVLWLASIVLVGSFPASLLIGAIFGLARGLSIFSVAGVDSSDDLVRFHRQLAARSGIVARIGSISLVALGVIAAAAALIDSGRLVG